jgi:hypothetical protein
MFEIYLYAEAGFRLLMPLMPTRFDAYGWDPVAREFWGDYAFCVMDNYGNAVPVSCYPYLCEGEPVLAPDYANPPAEGEPYPYIMYYPTCH